MTKQLPYKVGQVFYKGNPIKDKQQIASCYEVHYEGETLVTVNFDGFGAGSYPLCTKTEKEDVVKINNGYGCDEIKLYL